MTSLTPEYEFVDVAFESVRYLEHGWPTTLCRWHTHEVLELHLIVATRGTAFIGDHVGTFEPGALYLIGPHLPHNWVSDRCQDAAPVEVRDMLVQFSARSIAALQDAFPECRTLGALVQRSRAGIAFDGFDAARATAHLAALRDTSGAERVMRLLSFLLELTAHPAQTQLSDGALAQVGVTERASSITAVVDHIAERFADDLTLDGAAKLAGMSPTAFSRKFRRQTGSKFSEFLTKVRIGQACAMLQTSDARVATICHDVGFRNLANFNRQFRKVKGVTPAAYRRLVRTELSHTAARPGD